LAPNIGKPVLVVYFYITFPWPVLTLYVIQNISGYKPNNMEINEEIQQQKYRSGYHKLSINILFTHYWLVSHIKTIFKKEDITLQQYNILRILRGSLPTPLSTQQIRNRMIDKMSDTSRIVDRLVLKSLVTKKISETDNRLVDVTINERGLELLAKLDDLEEKTAKIMSNITDQEAYQLSDFLDKLHSI
jgi:DNA-binding MarR family transcriptional regulator